VGRSGGSEYQAGLAETSVENFANVTAGHTLPLSSGAVEGLHSALSPR
jgi:hypothetical protein